jgi:hypothetical protein
MFATLQDCATPSVIRMLYFRPFAIPRHPLLRLALAALGIALMFFVLMFGLVIGAVLLGFGALAWLIRQFTQGSSGARPSVGNAPPSTATPGVIEGEYVVLPKRDGKAD